VLASKRRMRREEVRDAVLAEDHGLAVDHGRAAGKVPLLRWMQRSRYRTQDVKRSSIGVLDEASACGRYPSRLRSSSSGVGGRHGGQDMGAPRLAAQERVWSRSRGRNPSALGGEVESAPRPSVFPPMAKALPWREGLSRGQRHPPSLREAGRYAPKLAGGTSEARAEFCLEEGRERH
jgi:hypothetical protein